MSWRDDVAAADDGPVRAGWEILDGLRSIAFTGAVEFPLMPAATVYLDRGRIYFAERRGDAAVADRLVAVGAVRPRDLAAGVLVVGDDHGVDHLGRLFTRVPSLDRQRVMLALELLTEETVAWIARQSVRHAVTQPYTYHTSGVHQWYDPAPSSPSPPASFTSFTSFAPPPTVRHPGDRTHTPADLAGVRIAWSEPAAPPPPAPEPPPARRWDPADWNAPTAPAVPTAPDVGAAAVADGPDARVARDPFEITDHFEVVWPSGDVGAPEAAFEPPPRPASTPGDGLDRFDGPLDGADLDYPSLPGDDADSREVAIAVRRAIAAVEAGGTRVRPVPTAPAPAPTPPGDVVGDDPFEATFTVRPPRPSPSELADEERRTALKRLIDAMRGR